MRHERHGRLRWTIAVLAIAGGAFALAGWASTSGAATDDGTGAPALAAGGVSCGDAGAKAVPPDTAPVPGADELQLTEAACKMRPQCSADPDCDAYCGAGLGKCVHSSCPIRICKCP